jgi:hypothetical protein
MFAVPLAEPSRIIRATDAEMQPVSSQVRIEALDADAGEPAGGLCGRVATERTPIQTCV